MTLQEENRSCVSNLLEKLANAEDGDGGCNTLHFYWGLAGYLPVRDAGRSEG